MKIFHIALISVLHLWIVSAMSRLVCYYDSSSYLRNGFAKMQNSDLELALQFCTHLVYGYASLDPTTFEVRSQNIDLDVFHYKEVTQLKAKYPKLKILLSVGGDHDIDPQHPNKYIGVLESTRELHQNFIDSSMILCRRNNFDGLDLAFQLPRNKPQEVHGTIGGYWKKFKKLFTGDFIVDEQAEQHKAQYTELAKNLQRSMAPLNLTLTMTVLPHVNATWYFDVPKIHQHFEYINLAAFDFVTPERNPQEADYIAPIYLNDEDNRLPYYNIEYQVNYWLGNKCPPSKLNLGINAYGRAWKLSSASGLAGVPVVHETLGAADHPTLTRTQGLLSWPEICSMISNDVNANYRGANAPLRKVNDLQRKYGNYAYRPADENDEHGLWVSFDDPDFASFKTNYAKSKGLGGISLFDLSLDDFGGLCTGQKYPILRSIKYFM